MNVIKRTVRALETVGYAADDNLAAQIALLLAARGQERVSAFLADGPSGSGKTSFAKAVARFLGVDYVYIQAQPGSVPEDFLYDANLVKILRASAGDAEAVQSAEDVIEFGFLPQVFQMSQEGLVVAFVDELDKSSAKTDSLFLAALQEGEVIVKGIGKIKANTENIVLFFTKNDERPISEPLLRRCRRHYFNFPSETLEIDILTGKVFRAPTLGRIHDVDPERMPFVPNKVAKVLAGHAAQMRERERKLIKPPSTQELAQAGRDAIRLVHWDRADLIGPVVSSWLAGFEEDRKVLHEEVVSEDRLRGDLLLAVRASVPNRRAYKAWAATLKAKQLGKAVEKPIMSWWERLQEWGQDLWHKLFGRHDKDADNENHESDVPATDEATPQEVQ